MSGLLESISRTTFLTKAESSTITTLIKVMLLDALVGECARDVFQFKIRGHS